MGDTAEYSQAFRYLLYVKGNNTYQGCGKCRYTACEKCDHGKAQNYVLRHGDVPKWFSKLKKACI